MREKTISFQDKNSEEALLTRYVNEISSNAPLSWEEEQQLSAQIKAGNDRAKDKLVKSNLMFVVSIARQYKSDGIDMLDLINEGNLGLIKAAGKFDASKGKRFVQMAVYDIRKAIEAFLPKDEVVMNRTASDSLEGTGKKADSAIIDSTDLEEMEDAISQLPEREQMVLKAYFGIGETQLTMMEIAMIHGLKRERVRQIRNRALRRLHSYRNKNFQ